MSGLVRVAHATTEVEARMVIGLLETYGVRATFTGNELIQHHPISGTLGGIHVVVVEEDAERAREILDAEVELS